MTPKEKFFCVRFEQSVTEVKRLLQDHRFSGAPLDEKEIHRYVGLERLEKNHGSFRQCGQVAEEIRASERISDNTTIEDIIEILANKEDCSPLFVTAGESVIGLVTAADLDKTAVKIYFFALISALESLLLDKISKGYAHYKTLLDNPKNVENRCRRCAGDKVGLEECNYLMTPEILEIVSKSEIGELIGVTDDSVLEGLRDFRNDVAHGNYIIVKDADIEKLKDRRDQICRYIHALELSGSNS